MIDSSTVDKATGLRGDQTVVFTNYSTKNDYSAKLRRIGF